MIHFLLLLFSFTIPLNSSEPSPRKLQTLYNSLDPNSVAQHLAFYELYGHTKQGQKAMQHAWKLMSLSSQASPLAAKELPLLPSLIPAIVALVNKQPLEAIPELTLEEIDGINKLSSHLANRKLQGCGVLSENDLLALPFDQVDLARGLFLSQLGVGQIQKIQSYEALLDLMTLQILARTPANAPPKAKVRAINDFIFMEMGFRFPPKSLYAKDIDVYTFLPSVLDSQRGVCLGISILYLCLAQRMGLSLEMITPPGHIYIRYRCGKEIINIETTARGVNLDSDLYLGINTRALQMRNIKEVIGLAYFNQASVYWQNKDHAEALRCYLKARDFLPNDALLDELMGYTYLFLGREAEGRELLMKIKDHIPEEAIVRESMAEDYLNGAVDPEGIKAIFQHVDEKRESIIAKQREIEAIVKKYPLFRAGWFHLAVTWLQLHRNSEALKVLEHYHTLDANDPTAEYYLAILYATRLDYNKAWKHLKHVEQIVQARQHHPKALKEMRRQLAILSPE